MVGSIIAGQVVSDFRPLGRSERWSANSEACPYPPFPRPYFPHRGS